MLPKFSINIIQWEPYAAYAHNYVTTDSNTQIGCDDMDWIELAQNSILWQSFVNMLLNLGVPWKQNLTSQMFVSAEDSVLLG